MNYPDPSLTLQPLYCTGSRISLVQLRYKILSMPGPGSRGDAARKEKGLNDYWIPIPLPLRAANSNLENLV